MFFEEEGFMLQSSFIEIAGSYFPINKVNARQFCRKGAKRLLVGYCRFRISDVG